ncbi:MAG: M20 family metallopeptidase [Luteolibacter sp.]
MKYDVVELLRDLIRIPSCNPDAPAGTPHVGEARIAEWLGDFLKHAGAEVVLEEIQPGRPNLIARFAPLDGRPRVLLGPHLDTVGVAGMSVDPFAAELRDGRVWGRGACDTKGPMAAMLCGWLEHAEMLAEAPVAVDFVAFMGEESAQWGSKDFAKRHGAEYRFAIVGEPTSMKAVRVTKGSVWATLRAHGRATHSSQPHRGENAALKLARALVALDQRLPDALARFTHPLLGFSTVNIGTFHSGTRPNIVPDLAEAEIDIRTTPALVEAGGALDLLASMIRELGLPVEIVNAHENPPMDTPGDHPDVHLLEAHGCEPTSAPWFSDAAHLSAGGVPSVCLGPGHIDQAHTADEFMDVAELEAGASRFSEIIKSLINPPEAATLCA